ncbi:GDSL-type esterase/lipase family protein [Sphaerisporangium krabiense]|uniref:Lysophospholipase L1-like esterase n=1 Tax=Sphaerisporangium krabiense TaxID=763782 RepID=A0A7W8Z4Y8_9ACTN|nr:GDSL-type esterase/lipase family protein [Sphaerisporangium krabiense]MBB5627485.1 lysophospholipase L1-like esterase [Sphaerisporangium krabiense]
MSSTDVRLRYDGAVSLQHGPFWTAPWRIPHAEAALYLPEGGIGRAAMPAGVRVALRTDSAGLTCHYQADPSPPLGGATGPPRLDLVCDGEPVGGVRLDADGRDAVAHLPGLPGRPGRMATVELWLPTHHQFRLIGLTLDEGAAVARDDRARPRWVHYGSSISQGQGAASPASTWPALVAREAEWDLTLLALGAACNLQPMMGRLIRDLPADLITACVGINIQALGTFNADGLVAALVGFVTTIREKHPLTPITVLSTIVAPDRETVPGPAGLTLREVRECVRRGVELLREHGDEHLSYVDGLELFGPDEAHLLVEPVGRDRLHLSPAGHQVFASRFLPAVRDARLASLPVK